MLDAERCPAAAGRSGARRSRRTQQAPGWLDQARALGDPMADVLFARLARTGKLADMDRALADVTSGRAALPAALPPQLRRFLLSEGLPAWADPARLLRAQRFAERHAVAIACALFCAALPSAFTGAKGVSVLRATRRLQDDVDRRVNETGRFVFDVLMPGGFESGSATRSTQKVRLLHAAVRHHVLGSRRKALRGAAAAVDPDSAGDIPINQEDLLGTLVCFSVVVLDALAKLGISVHPDEAEDFLHLWRVVGALLGIREAWLPRSVEQARALGEIIRRRQGVATEDGRELASVLLDGIERHLPARGLRLVAPGLMRHFLGEDVAHMLALPEGVRAGDLSRLLPQATSLLARLGRGALGEVLPKLGRSVLELMMDHKLGGQTPGFQRPLSSVGCPARSRNGAPHGGKDR